MAIYYIISTLIFFTSVFAYVNERWIKWPPTIGIMVLSLFSSLLLVIIGRLVPGIADGARSLADHIDFAEVLLKIMLSFLLFAGAIHIDALKLRKVIWPVATLSTVGVFISTLVISVLAFYLFAWFKLDIPYLYCLLFGALISPTDPIAVMAILKKAKIPASLELKIAGESLFNDGVGVVAFLTILEAASFGPKQFSVTNTLLLFLREAGGGILFGIVLGYAGHFSIKSIDNYRVEVLITLAVVMCGYTIADRLHLSAPLAIIIAGIIMGTKSRNVRNVSPVSREYLNKFWDLIDEIFNAILFLIIGLEILVIKINLTVTFAGVIMIGVVLLARWFSVWLPLLLLRFRIRFEKNAVAILTWGGLRGGLSVAMALSIPASMHREEIVLITYIIVIFSIIIQGLTIGSIAAKLVK